MCFFANLGLFIAFKNKGEMPFCFDLKFFFFKENKAYGPRNLYGNLYAKRRDEKFKRLQ